MTAWTPTTLLYTVEDGIATITLNRPERLNAISVPMLDALSEALVAADQDRTVRVIVLTGAGKGFCSGLDLKDLAAGKTLAEELIDRGAAHAKMRAMQDLC